MSSGTNVKDRRSAARSLRRVRNERSGPTSCPEGPRPTLLPGHRPFLPAVRAVSVSPLRGLCRLRLVYRPEAVVLPQPPGLLNFLERTHRLLTGNLFPLESPGALGYSPVAFRFLALLFPI